MSTDTDVTSAETPADPHLAAMSVHGDIDSFPAHAELVRTILDAGADACAGLLVTGLPVDRDADRLDRPRASLVGRLEPYAPTAAERHEHLDRHPGTATYADFPDFGWWRPRVDAARYVGGFGHMSWVTGREIAEATPDPVLAAAQPALDHMNADHSRRARARAEGRP